MLDWLVAVIDASLAGGAGRRLVNALQAAFPQSDFVSIRVRRSIGDVPQSQAVICWQVATIHRGRSDCGPPSPNRRLTGDPRAILDFIGNPGSAMAPTFRFLLALCTLVLTVHSPVAQAGEPVNSLLVLAADVSRSIDQPKFQLQREGYAAAISHPRVLNAIASGLRHRIAVCFIEWLA